MKSVEQWSNSKRSNPLRLKSTMRSLRGMTQRKASMPKRKWFSSYSPYYRLQRPKEAIGAPWPLSELSSFDFPANSDVGWGRLLVDVLRARGWRFSTKPCHIVKKDPSVKRYTVWIKEFEASLRGSSPEAIFGKRGALQEGYHMQPVKLRSHALWMMTWTSFIVPGTCGGRCTEREDFVKAVVQHGKNLAGHAGNYRIAKFPGTETAFFKTNLSDAFKGQPWWPICYTLPSESKELRQAISQGNTHWIAKPKNDFGGEGISVWRGDDPTFKKIIDESKGQRKSVVQSYLANPLLIGGYKFHMRLHMCVTSLNPPQAFVQRNGQCLFATKPYTLAQNTLGESFQAPIHITNMTFNATAKNKENFLRSKPVIGKGQQFRISHMETLLSKTHPKYDEKFLWGQVTHIAAEVVRYMARAPSIRKHGTLVPDRHFELTGMDLMLDKDLNVFMCEVNTDPGLDYPDKLILGEPNPDFDKETGLASDTWHDVFTLLGLDSGHQQERGSLRNWLRVDFPEHANNA